MNKKIISEQVALLALSKVQATQLAVIHSLIEEVGSAKELIENAGNIKDIVPEAGPRLCELLNDESLIVNAEKEIEFIEKNNIIILAGFMTILTENFTAKWPKRIINVHPALIPSFCGEGFYGLRVHQAALDYGVKVTGATVHFVNEIPDGGEIIAQKAVYIEDGDTPEILQRRVMEQAEWILLPQAAEKVCASM